MANRAAEPRVPMTLQRARLKAEEKTLDFEFEVVNVQFNEKGRYALRLTVENPLLEGSGAGVRLQVNEGDVLYTSSGTTDIIEQSSLCEIYTFERRRFLFTLPKGFCKNDKNHDVRLRIEALRLCGSSLKSSLRAGEAFFAIYPRTNQPRMNLFARKDEDLYRYSDIMALLRVGEDELAMHCGRLAYAVSFHEHRLPARKETSVSSHQLSPWLSAREDGEQDEEALPGVLSTCTWQVLEAPSEMDEAVQTSETNHWHLAHSGKESISVTLHNASNLPATQKGKVPWPYVTVKSSSDVEKKREAQGVTHVSSEPTHSPTWEEKVTVEIDAEDAGHEGMISEETMKMRPSASPAVDLTTVMFPDPSMVAFDVPRVSNQGYPQVTQPGGPPEKPTWNSSFLFQGRDGATLFSDDCSLVIEYYPYKTKTMGYSEPSPPALFSSDPLPTAKLSPSKLYCCFFQRPDMFLTPSITDTLPILDPKLLGKIGAIREPWAQSSSLVPYASVKGDKLKLALQPPDEVNNYRTAMKKMADDILSLRRHVASLEAENSTLRRNLSMHEETCPHATDRAVWSLAVALKHKLAAGTVEMSRMKDRVQQLQNELIRKNDREKDLVMLQRAHQQQQTVLRKYQEKITKMKALEDTVRQQERVIEKMERMLEEKVPETARTCEQLESAGGYGGKQRSEQLLCSSPPADSVSKEFYSTLLTENMRLREELSRAHYRSSPIILQQQALPVRWVGLGPYHGEDPLLASGSDSLHVQDSVAGSLVALSVCIICLQDMFSTNSEKLSLLAKVEKAQGRIRVLESQLEESARKWGREKQDLSTRLLEQEHGFGRSSSTILHDFSLVSDMPAVPGNPQAGLTQLQSNSSHTQLLNCSPSCHGHCTSGWCRNHVTGL
uniref:Coiled-coil domain containing 33 n=1 Tax=Gopherus evgoodei TaxID=1825980 RepID=A0A8C4YRU6_9SAUR